MTDTFLYICQRKTKHTLHLSLYFSQTRARLQDFDKSVRPCSRTHKTQHTHTSKRVFRLFRFQLGWGVLAGFFLDAALVFHLVLHK